MGLSTFLKLLLSTQPIFNLHIVRLCFHVGFPNLFPKNWSGRVDSRERMFTFSPQWQIGKTCVSQISRTRNLFWIHFLNTKTNFRNYEPLRFSMFCRYILHRLSVVDKRKPCSSQVSLSETFALQFTNELKPVVSTCKQQFRVSPFLLHAPPGVNPFSPYPKIQRAGGFIELPLSNPSAMIGYCRWTGQR
jgi:hypothetical protein